MVSLLCVLFNINIEIIHILGEVNATQTFCSGGNTHHNILKD